MATRPAPDWIRRVPKVELHLHLEGSIRPQLLRRLARKNGIALPPLEDSFEEPAYRYSEFLQFLGCFKTACSVLASPDDLAEVAENLFDELAAQNVVYAEIFLSPIIHERRGISAVDTMRLIHGIAQEKRRRNGLHCRFLFDGVRQWGVDSCRRSIQLAEVCRHWGVVGIGIGGDEASIPAEAFAASFARAKSGGLHLTAHAGEVCGASSVREALTHLKPERIGHGIRSVEDPELLNRLQDLGVTLDISLASNIRTGAWLDLKTHPAQPIRQSGVSITLNTDDPALFFTTLTDEYQRGVELLELNAQGLASMVRGALQASFLSAAERREVDRALSDAFIRIKTPKET